MATCFEQARSTTCTKIFANRPKPSSEQPYSTPPNDPKHPYCNLPNDIHPILARHNWLSNDVRKQDELWTDLQPALRFASQVLTNDYALLWWTHLLYGRVSRMPSCHCTYLAHTELSFSIAAVAHVKPVLLLADNRIKFSFSHCKSESGLIYGMTTWCSHSTLAEVDEKKNAALPNKLTSGFHMEPIVSVRFNRSFKDYFSSGERSPVQDVHTSFLLGLTIVHELAHAVYVLHSSWTARTDGTMSPLQISNCNGTQEPFFYYPGPELHRGARRKPELGWSLEEHLFGLHFHAVMTSQRGAVPMRQESAFEEFRPNGQMYGSVVWTKTEDITPFFRHRKWQHIADGGGTCWCGRCLPKAGIMKELPPGYTGVWIPRAVLIEHSDNLYTYSDAPPPIAKVVVKVRSTGTLEIDDISALTQQARDLHLESEADPLPANTDEKGLALVSTENVIETNTHDEPKPSPRRSNVRTEVSAGVSL